MVGTILVVGIASMKLWVQTWQGTTNRLKTKFSMEDEFDHRGTRTS
jgi:hypothetical protein